MGIQDLFTLVLTLLLSSLPCAALLQINPVFADSARCFDFSAQQTQVLKPTRISGLSEKSGASRDALSGDSYYWAIVQGDAPTSLANLYGFLSDRNSTRSSRVDRMDVTDEKDPHFLLKQRAHYEVDPFPFITVEWTEQWAFSLLSGTVDTPQKILVSYEKVAGTSHIKHLCGNILLSQPPDSKNTHVVLYEEAQATGRSQEDTLNGLKSTLQTLQGRTK